MVSDTNSSTSFIREPLVHFLLIGAALFVLYGLVNDDVLESDDRIEITDGTVERLTEGWKRTWQRPPTEAELRGLIDGYIREEVLVREAFALGLDADDIIIRRRLAQKMEFITEDLGRLAEPQDSDLQRFFDEHPEMFREPARLSFRLIYFNTDNRADAATDARRLLESLRSGQVIDLDSAGDRLMLDANYELATERNISRVFGAKLAAALFATETNGWQGPFESGYGLHLAKISDRRAARLPEFTAVHEAVMAAWLDAEQKRMEQAVFERLKSRYEIVYLTSDGSSS
jgi:peptidyl-prolyl cis-trans isomerase C